MLGPFRRGGDRAQDDDGLYRGLLEQIPAVTYVAEAGPRGRWTFVSPQVEALLGYAAGKWTAKPELWIRSVHPDDRERVLAAQGRAHETGEPLAIEYRMRRRDGTMIWVRDEAVVTRRRPAAVLEGWLTDVTQRKRAEQSLEEAAVRDPLTGLLNRRRFDDELEQCVHAGAAGGAGGALLLLDVDNFKAINDSRGHEVGDRVLRSVARALEDTLRQSDVIARLGGDEFGVLAKSVSESDAWGVGASALSGVRSRTAGLGVTVSVGVAILDGRHGASAAAARVAADAALYHAKELGRDTVCLYHPGLAVSESAPAP